MAIPKYNEIILPILNLLKDNSVLSLQSIREELFHKKKLKDYYPDILTDDDFNIELESGRNYIIVDRIGWALSYSSMFNLLQKPKRGEFQITEFGLEILKNKDQKTINQLVQEKRKLNDKRKSKKDALNQEHSQEEYNQDSSDDNDFLTFEDQLAKFEINQKIEIQNTYKEKFFPSEDNKDWNNFEKFCLKFLEHLGYGVNKDSFKQTAKTRDGGIDGIVYRDKLGFDKIVVQAKFYQEGNKINADTIKTFIYNIQNHKGLFITTSEFTKDAQKVIDDNKDRGIFIDGQTLLDLMYKHKFALNIASTHYIFEVNEDMFS